MSSHVVKEDESCQTNDDISVNTAPSFSLPPSSSLLSSSPHQPGVAQIKAQYVIQKRPLDVSSATPTSPPTKRRKVRGQNKHRPPTKLNFSSQLCPSLHNSLYECSYKDKCRYNHDIKDFLLNKPPDISDTCYIYTIYGNCPSGVACRFGAEHISAEGVNIVNKTLYDKEKVNVKNVLSKSLQIELRKKKICFVRSDHYLKNIKNNDIVFEDVPNKGVTNTKEGVASADISIATTEEHVASVDGANTEVGVANTNGGVITTESMVTTEGGVITTEEGVVTPEGGPVTTEEGVVTKEELAVVKQDVTGKVTTVGPFTDEECIKLRSSEKKKIDFRNKLYLAPLTTVGNLPFRRICKKFGADITCGEMALAVKLLQGQQSEWALMRRHESEDLFGVQVCGSFQDSMTKCAELISTKCDVDFIDINVGCPLDMVYKKGGGCGLMQRKGRFEQIVRGMSNVIDCPLTVKMRTGVYDKNWNAHKLAPCVKEWGASLLSIHGRSREQRYTHLADWDYINKCAELADPMPVFGNGDILSFEDHLNALTNRRIAGIMIARGALIKPWLFTEIKEQRHWDISSSERFEILRDYTNYGLENWGSDTLGVERTRRFLLEWLSFLHRYIPVGLLERLPQKINERPPKFYGRDDLETMMSSRNCQDWIKMSEMLLGPVPDNFSFLPKHKANSYNTPLINED